MLDSNLSYANDEVGLRAVREGARWVAYIRVLKDFRVLADFRVLLN